MHCLSHRREGYGRKHFLQTTISEPSRVEGALLLWVLVLPRIRVLYIAGVCERAPHVAMHSKLPAFLVPKVSFLFESGVFGHTES